MARPPLPLGTFGKIRIRTAGTRYIADTKFRDYDGVTRRVERVGATKGRAEAHLREALRDRIQRTGTPGLSSDTRVSVLAESWFAEVERNGLSPSTVRVYRDRVDQQVIPALGALRVHELRTGVIARHLTTVMEKNGASVARTTRTVLSGMCSYAARHDLLTGGNPVRDVGRISVKPRRRPAALELPRALQLRAYMTYDNHAIERDLPDLAGFLLATALRIGEGLAVIDDAFDASEGAVDVRGTVIRLKGRGLVLKEEPKSEAGHRRLRLPDWGVHLVERRFAATQPTEIEILEPMGRGSSCLMIRNERHRLLFPTVRYSRLGLRDPSNVSNQLKAAFAWAGEDVTSHILRKTVASLFDDAGLPAREGADQLGHSKVSLFQHVYLGRKIASERAAEVLKSLAL